MSRYQRSMLELRAATRQKRRRNETETKEKTEKTQRRKMIKRA